MADDVTKLGGGWDQAPSGTAEFALGKLLAEGRLTGEDVIVELKALGFGARGPAYYPILDGKGPYYALGAPHDYAAIDVVDGVKQWDLINFDPSTVPVQPVPLPSTPVPPATLGDVLAALSLLEEDVAALRAVSLPASVFLPEMSKLHDYIDTRVGDVQQQIDQAIHNAEASGKKISDALSPILPGLSGLFTKP